MKTASFHTTARKAILATLQANRDDLRMRDTREWRFLTDEEFRRSGPCEAVGTWSYAGRSGRLRHGSTRLACGRGLRRRVASCERIQHIRHAHRIRRQDRMGDGMRRT